MTVGSVKVAVHRLRERHAKAGGVGGDLAKFGDAAADGGESLHRRLGGAALAEGSAPAEWATRLHLEVRSGDLAAILHRRHGSTAEGDQMPNRHLPGREIDPDAVHFRACSSNSRICRPQDSASGSVKLGWIQAARAGRTACARTSSAPTCASTTAWSLASLPSCRSSSAQPPRARPTGRRRHG